MDSSFLSDFANRIRAMMALARTDAARRQLAMWLEEFEGRFESGKDERGMAADKKKINQQ
jgi:hypothetical protein